MVVWLVGVQLSTYELDGFRLTHAMMFESGRRAVDQSSPRVVGQTGPQEARNAKGNSVIMPVKTPKAPRRVGLEKWDADLLALERRVKFGVPVPKSLREQ